MGDPPTRAREVASILSFTILRYLSLAVGRAEAERVRVAAGETRTMAELVDRGAWTSVDSVVAIAAEARRLTGDPEIGRRGGEELLRFMDETGVSDLHRALGSPEAALAAAVEASSKVSVGRVAKVVESGPSRVLIESVYTRNDHPNPLFCDYSLGYWGSIPSLFGARGYAVELECQARGDNRCLTQISWIEFPAAAIDSESARARADRAFLSYEELQRTTADLIAAEDVSAVLDLVVERAGHAVLAPRFLLVVQMATDRRPRVHHLGFADFDEAQRAADTIGDGGPATSVMVVEVASKSRRYGYLAAFYPAGTEGTRTDRRLMTAYAAHAVAALESTAALRQAQRDRDTAQALLDLSRRLAGTSTVAEVSQTLADAVPFLTGGACSGSLHLWEAGSQRLVLGAVDSSSHGSESAEALLVAALDGAADLLATGDPVFLDVDALTGDLRLRLESSGVAHIVSLPIVARGEFLGLVSVSLDQRVVDDDRALLLDRLSAFTDQAATALDNARLIERTRYHATHDVLTGLPNRPMLEDRANQLLAESRRTQRSFGLLFVDLDRFKNVNDTLGHHAGDDLIRQVASRLRRELRDTDTLARLGGDEFVVLLPGVVDQGCAERLAERLVRTLDEPFSVAGTSVFVSCSVGVSMSNGDSDYETLLGQADAAMYRAKSAGANRYVMHAPTFGPSRQRRLEMESALHGAIANGELRVAYQAQVELESGRIVGAEALVRWDHPVLGAVGPDVFVPIAEDAGLILEIDRWVRLTALAQMATWLDAGLPPLRMAFNMSTRELADPTLPAELAGDIAAAGIDPSWIELEITERVVMADDEDLVAVLDALHAIGVRLAIDDFGTGSSVLRRLQRHPIDTLKIDRSFMGDITSSSPAVVAALVQMGESLGIEVLAEGVETDEQRVALGELGCRLAQGYLFSRPVPADELAGQLAAGSLGSRLVVA